jgi:uncharacterized protein YcbK (DUF882 family)
MQLTKNFQLSEFACKDGTPVPDEYLDNVKELAKELQVLRDFLESPLRINSAYRTKTYNKSVGGAEKSKHLVAMAADLSSPKYTPSQIRAAILKLIKEKKMRDGGIGYYNTFIHYDISTPRRWDLRK